jgi:hypothetical protein
VAPWCWRPWWWWWWWWWRRRRRERRERSHCRGGAMSMWDSNEARVCVADNADTGATAEQFSHTWAALWVE